MAPRTTDARSRCRSNPHLVRRPYPPARFAHSCRGLSQRRPTTHISCLLVGVAPAAARACSVRWMLSTLFACRKIRKCDICVRKKQIPPGDRLAAPTRRSVAGMSRLPRSNHRSKLVANKVAEDNRAIALFVVRSLDITKTSRKAICAHEYRNGMVTPVGRAEDGCRCQCDVLYSRCGCPRVSI